MKKGNHIAFKGLSILSNLATNIYQILIILLMSSLLMSMFGSAISIDGVADILFNLSLTSELVLVVIYVGLTLVLSKFTSIVGTGRVYQGVEVWRITSFWMHLKETMCKDMLIWNGALLALLSFITRG